MSDIKILNVSKQGKKYKVETSLKEYIFTADTIIKFLISKDKVFSETEFTEAIKYDSFSVVLNKTLNFLSYQNRSVQEVRNYLTQRTDSEETEKIIKRLTDLGYLNDSDYANSYLDYVLRNYKGPRFLEENLKSKGIDEALIKETLKKYDDELEKKILSEFIEKHKNKQKNKPLKKQKLLMMQRSQRAGFNFEAISDCLKKTDFVDESEDQLAKEIEKLANKYSELDSRGQRDKIISRLMRLGYTYSDILLHLNNEE
jgi:regulatory protein